MLFSEVIGQENVKNELRETIQLNRVAHAYLFTGPEGSGKLPLALAYAQYLNCEHPTETDACGECPSCKAYAKLQHPDLHFVFPIVKDKTNDKICCDDYLGEWRELFAQNPYISLEMWQEYIGVENKQPIIYESEAAGDKDLPRIKGVIKKLAISNFSAKYKVMVIWMAEKMNEVCANKILKILEEPTPNTLFLLIAEDTRYMLPTILSRTQIVRIPKIDDASLATKIQNDFMLQGDDLHSIVKNANGNYIQAFKMATSDNAPSQYFDLFTRMMRCAYMKDVFSLNTMVEEIDALGREKQKSFLMYCLREVRENFIRNQNIPEILYMDKQENTFAEKFHPYINERNVAGFTKEFNAAHYHILRNGNPKIVFFDLFMKIIVLIRA
ncbi:MAG: DNA polymerase III subunit delta [Bacteroidales bacterium]|nr:DNA polymerase III subunit delta [Bacteroidales bacterium]